MILPLVALLICATGLRRIDRQSGQTEAGRQKGRHQIDDEEHLHRENRIRPCKVFLLDDNGKVVGQAVRWVIGGTKE